VSRDGAVVFIFEGRCCNLPTGLEESLIYQLYAKGKRNANGANVVVLVVSPPKSIMKDQIEEMEELGIPSIVLSTKDVLLPI